MNQSEGFLLSLPDDIVLKIVNLLQFSDVCSLSSCCRALKNLCGLDSVWLDLCNDRWPNLEIVQNTLGSLNNGELPVIISADDAVLKGWKEFYIYKHMEISMQSQIVIGSMKYDSNEFVKVKHYQTTMEKLWRFEFEFKDVEIFFFKPNLSGIINLVGLHYCIDCLEIPCDELIEALSRNKIIDRDVIARWWKYGEHFQDILEGFDNEFYFHGVSLEDIALSEVDLFMDLVRTRNSSLTIRLSSCSDI
ncbi:uncharacterized protein LOC124916807 [Impatiens glandulifera]|uniref:uncharacterized protein LOC124916807 n=1 Tax=Impatiens glandulifera TaxID=253017 RepID=UPI001FB1633E|nr:uncharacterized protein LOC124916807 [Impatiens glandulifera]